VIVVGPDQHNRCVSQLPAQIIDSILDYSKLEASGGLPSLSCERGVDSMHLAVKLDSSAFSIENIVAVCGNSRSSVLLIP